MRFPFLLVLASIAAPTYASVVFTNFGTTSPGYGGSASSVNSGESLAVGFTPTTGAQLSSIIVPINNQNANSSLTVALYSDSAGAPGSSIEVFTYQSASISSAAQLLTSTSITNPTLTAGTLYWIVLSSAASSNFYGWYSTNSGANGLEVNSGSGWRNISLAPQLAVEVNGTSTSSTPERQRPPAYLSPLSRRLSCIWA